MTTQEKLAALLHKAAHRAETSKSLKCPACGELLPEGWRTDDVTGDTDNNDEDNQGDGVDGAEQDNDEFDNRRPIDRLNALAKSLAAASTNQSKK
jgi:hypothetical protein